MLVVLLKIDECPLEFIIKLENMIFDKIQSRHYENKGLLLI